ILDYLKDVEKLEIEQAKRVRELESEFTLWSNIKSFGKKRAKKLAQEQALKERTLDEAYLYLKNYLERRISSLEKRKKILSEFKDMEFDPEEALEILRDADKIRFDQPKQLEEV